MARFGMPGNWGRQPSPMQPQGLLGMAGQAQNTPGGGQMMTPAQIAQINGYQPNAGAQTGVYSSPTQNAFNAGAGGGMAGPVATGQGMTPTAPPGGLLGMAAQQSAGLNASQAHAAARQQAGIKQAPQPQGTGFGSQYPWYQQPAGGGTAQPAQGMQGMGQAFGMGEANPFMNQATPGNSALQANIANMQMANNMNQAAAQPAANPFANQLAGGPRPDRGMDPALMNQFGNSAAGNSAMQSHLSNMQMANNMNQAAAAPQPASPWNYNSNAPGMTNASRFSNFLSFLNRGR